MKTFHFTTPRKHPKEERYPRDISRDLTKKRWQLQPKKSTRDTSTISTTQRHTSIGSQISRQQLEATKPYQASTKRSLSRCTDPYPRKVSSLTRWPRPQRSRKVFYRRYTIKDWQLGEADTDPEFNNTSGLQVESTHSSH